MAETGPTLAHRLKEYLKKRRIPNGGDIVALVLLAGIVAVLIYGSTAEVGWLGVADKTVWDYLELLIVPVVLTYLVYWLNRSQRVRELEIENQRAQDAVLQSYIDQMTQLLVNEDAHKSPREDNILREIKHARILHVLEQLDESGQESRRSRRRKSDLLSFSYKTGLIPGRKPHSKDDMRMLYSMLYRANFRGADLKELRLPNADLRDADFSGAKLTRAILDGAILDGAKLEGADLSYACLKGARVTDEQLSECRTLEGAIMPDGQTLKGDTVTNGPTFENWLKSKGYGVDEETSSPS